MPRIPIEIRFEITPDSRFDLIDIRQEAAGRSETLRAFPQALYSSFHTTAGFLEPGLISSLNRPIGHGVHTYIRLFRRLFPERAGYQHDNLPLRRELSDSQRMVEPCNGDAHLAFICSGMCNNVKYINRPEEPIFLVDLDGVVAEGPRRRVTSILAFTEEQVVARGFFSIPAPSQAIVALNLKDTRFGIYEYLHQQIARYGIAKGRAYIRLPADEHHASLMVNEYEPLLMQDLIDVLQNPLHFVTEEDHHLFTNCWRNGDKLAGHDRSNFSSILGQEFRGSQANGSLPEMSFTEMNILNAYQMLGLKRSISLLVSDQQVPGCGFIVDGAFQYPIMMEWANGNSSPRKIEIMLTRFV